MYNHTNQLNRGARVEYRQGSKEKWRWFIVNKHVQVIAYNLRGSDTEEEAKQRFQEVYDTCHNNVNNTVIKSITYMTIGILVISAIIIGTMLLLK